MIYAVVIVFVVFWVIITLTDPVDTFRMMAEYVERRDFDVEFYRVIAERHETLLALEMHEGQEDMADSVMERI